MMGQTPAQGLMVKGLPEEIHPTAIMPEMAATAITAITAMLTVTTETGTAETATAEAETREAALRAAVQRQPSRSMRNLLMRRGQHCPDIRLKCIPQ